MRRRAMGMIDVERRGVIRAAGASLLIALAACSSDQSAVEGLAPGKLGRVRRIVSGDTFEFDDDEVVHLAGVEAPRGDQPYADEAVSALDGLAGGRQVQLLHGGARTDPFGRTVAQVRVVDSRVWLEGALVDAGAVRVRTYADNRALAKLMLAREARARSANRGLWALADYRIRLPEEIEGAHGLTLVEGRIEHAGRTLDGDVYLDFSGDWRSNFSAEIPRAALHDFRSAGMDPINLQGKLVRIRGGARGLRLTLDHPEQVERLRG